MRRLLAALLTLAFAQSALAQQARIASDFEVARIERQLAASRDFLAQLSGRLNLGDVRNARNERSLARTEYQRALTLAQTERKDARAASDLARYATATSYAGLAEAKLGHKVESFALLEESIRFGGDDAKSWNLYSSAMSVLGLSSKAIASARNAVRIADRDLAADPTLDRRLDLAVHRHALAAALVGAGMPDQAERELERLSESLRAREFDAIRRQAARAESFEIFSTARGNVAAYVSLYNRAHLRLAALYEQRGARDLAIRSYQRVLEARNDDATALMALARLATDDAERRRRYEEAFDANPFASALVRDYRAYVRQNAHEEGEPVSVGARMRAALALLEQGQKRAARERIEELLSKFPANETLLALRREIDQPAAASESLVPGPSPAAAELRRLLDALSVERLTSVDRVALDAATFIGEALFDPAGTGAAGQTVLASGTIAGIAFRFAQPTAFAGTFDTSRPLRLTYRILGATRAGDADVLLLEPLRVEVAP